MKVNPRYSLQFVCLLSILGLYMAGKGPIVSARVVSYDFTVRYFNAAPDGVQKRVLGVNDQFPGPTVRAKIGDTLEVKVTNMIQTHDNTTIHWHGIEQLFTPFQDGPEMVTQCPIVYGATQVYSFKLRQSGTYWWHAHHSWQYTQGVWGALIVDNDPEVYAGSYDGEFVVTVTDWYHLHGKVLSDWYLSPASQGNEPIPDSVMLNGRGSYPCATAVLAGLNCSESNQANVRPSVFTVDPGKTYRFRLINTSAMTLFTFAIDDHKLETIEVDGVDTVRVGPVDNVKIQPAMRYSFLVTMNAGSNTAFWIRATALTVAYRTPPNINVYYPAAFEAEVKAILLYRVVAESVVLGTVVPVQPPSGTQGRPAIHGVDWNNQTDVFTLIQANNENLHASKFQAIVGTSDHIIDADSLGSSVYLNIQGTQIPQTQSLANNSQFLMAEPPFPATEPVPAATAVTLDPSLCRPYPGDELAPASFDEQVVIDASVAPDRDGITRWKINGVTYLIGTKPVIFEILQNEAIPVFVNANRITLGKVIQIVINNRSHGGHPFHLHGHTFWVMGNGAANAGDYDPTLGAGSLQTNGVRRDTTGIAPSSWTVLRFVADNPGPWLFHCHINWHLQNGLGAVFIEGEETIRSIYTVPRESEKVCRAAGIQIS